MVDGIISFYLPYFETFEFYPYLTNVFFVTYLTKGVVATPINWPNDAVFGTYV